MASWEHFTRGNTSCCLTTSAGYRTTSHASAGYPCTTSHATCTGRGRGHLTWTDWTTTWLSLEGQVYWNCQHEALQIRLLPRTGVMWPSCDHAAVVFILNLDPHISKAMHCHSLNMQYLWCVSFIWYVHINFVIGSIKWHSTSVTVQLLTSEIGVK